jgi:hypothetical protein
MSKPNYMHYILFGSFFQYPIPACRHFSRLFIADTITLSLGRVAARGTCCENSVTIDAYHYPQPDKSD